MSKGTHLTSEVRQRAAIAVVEGMAIADVSAAYNVDRKTVSRWVAKFRDRGGDGLQRKAGSGRPRKLEELTEEELARSFFRERRHSVLKQIFGQSVVCAASSATSFESSYRRIRFGDDFAMRV